MFIVIMLDLQTFLYNLLVMLKYFRSLFTHMYACFCMLCMVLSYARIHSNLSTCATGCPLLLAFVIQAASPLYFFTLFLLILLCKSMGE